MTRERIRWPGLLPRLGKLLLAAQLAGFVGCSGDVLSRRSDDPYTARAASKDDAPAELDGESLILRPDGFSAEKAAPSSTFPEEITTKLQNARELFRRQEYAKAEDVFGDVADKEKNPPLAIQEATYYRAECLRLQGYFPKAADTYVSLMNKFPGTSYREQCCQHVYDIANQWLDETRAEMREAKEKQEGKRWMVWPRFVSFEKAKPFLDREGRAIEKLEQVRMHDVNGPLADKSLFLCGVVKMYNENFREADHYFSQIYQRHPDSPLTPKALELGIQCKHLSTGGSDYDGRKSAEARKMVAAALGNYPQLANDKDMRNYLEGQMGSIDVQQAEKEYKMAEFYRRTGHPGSAYFYYELVRRRYPGTRYAKLAEERWNDLRAEVEREQQGKQDPKQAVVVPPKTAPAAPASVLIIRQ